MQRQVMTRRVQIEDGRTGLVFKLHLNLNIRLYRIISALGGSYMIRIP